MITTIARKEMAELTRDGRFRLAFGLAALLLLVALVFGWLSYTQSAAERARAQSDDRRVWLSQGPRNPHSAAHFGRYLFKPTTPLSFVDQGLNPYLGVAAFVEAHTQTPLRDRAADDATALARFGELTAATVLQLLVPLLIVLVTFGAFAGEREAGTLRQVFSLGVPGRALLLGKLAGTSSALFAILVPLTLIGSAALVLSGAPEGQASLPRLGFMMLGYLLYFGALMGIALGVSAMVRSARTALVVLLGFWMMNCVLVPRLAADVANRLHPAPSMQAFLEQVKKDMRNGIDGHDPEDRRTEELKQRMLVQYKVAKVEELPINFDAVAMQAGEEHGNEVLDHHYNRLWDGYVRQARVGQAFAFASPLLALRPFSMAMAGTDLVLHRAFSLEAERYRRGFIALLNNHMRDHSKTGDWDWKADSAFWAQAPEFTFRTPTVSESLSVHGSSLAILAVWCAAALLFALWAVRRMPVEA